MNMHEALETTFLPIELHYTIKCSSMTIMSYWSLASWHGNHMFLICFT